MSAAGHPEIALPELIVSAQPLRTEYGLMVMDTDIFTGEVFLGGTYGPYSTLEQAREEQQRRSVSGGRYVIVSRTVQDFPDDIWLTGPPGAAPRRRHSRLTAPRGRVRAAVSRRRR